LHRFEVHETAWHPSVPYSLESFTGLHGLPLLSQVEIVLIRAHQLGRHLAALLNVVQREHVAELPHQGLVAPEIVVADARNDSVDLDLVALTSERVVHLGHVHQVHQLALALAFEAGLLLLVGELVKIQGLVADVGFLAADHDHAILYALLEGRADDFENQVVDQVVNELGHVDSVKGGLFVEDAAVRQTDNVEFVDLASFCHGFVYVVDVGEVHNLKFDNDFGVGFSERLEQFVGAGFVVGQEYDLFGTEESDYVDPIDAQLVGDPREQYRLVR